MSPAHKARCMHATHPAQESMSRSASPASLASSDKPSFVERLDLVALASLASSTRASLDSKATPGTTCTVDPLPIIGGYNVVFFITFSDGVRWACRIPITEWSPMLEERLRVDLACLQFIERRTSIPVPTVHIFNTSNDNALGRPYTFISVMTGTKLSKLWFDQAWFTEERRLRFWRSLAHCVSQLAQFEFAAIGTPICDAETGEYSVVSFVCSRSEIEDDDEDDDTSVSAGPYTSVQQHLLSAIAGLITKETDAFKIATLRLLQPYVHMLPEADLSGPPFVLAHPDLNYQNIFVDDEGNVTAIMDWDDMSVRPRQSGCCQYPSWITRDWDPTMYGYYEHSEGSESDDEAASPVEDVAPVDSKPTEESKPPSPPKSDVAGTAEPIIPAEADIAPGSLSQDLVLDWERRQRKGDDSREVLQRFRDEYYAATQEVAPALARWTRNSHILEAIQIAVWVPMLRQRIGDKLHEYVFGPREYGDPSHPFLDLALRMTKSDWTREVTRNESDRT